MSGRRRSHHRSISSADSRRPRRRSTSTTHHTNTSSSHPKTLTGGIAFPVARRVQLQQYARVLRHRNKTRSGGTCGGPHSFGEHRCECGCGSGHWKECRCGGHCSERHGGHAASGPSGCTCHLRQRKMAAMERAQTEAAAIMTVDPVSSMSSTTALRHGGDAEASRYVVGSVESHMIQLWDEHFYLTREVLIGLTKDLGSVSVALKGLLTNQDNIAWLFVSLYGKERSDSVALLLREHIDLAGKIISALLAGKRSNAPDWTSSPTVADLVQKWNKNGQDIAEGLYQLNPGLYDQLYGMHVTIQAIQRIRTEYREFLGMHLQQHLDLLTKEVITYIDGKYEESLSVGNAGLRQVREMALVLAKIAVGYQVPPPAVLHHQLFQSRYGGGCGCGSSTVSPPVSASAFDGGVMYQKWDPMLAYQKDARVQNWSTVYVALKDVPPGVMIPPGEENEYWKVDWTASKQGGDTDYTLVLSH